MGIPGRRPYTVASGLDIGDPQIEVYSGTVHVVWRFENSGEIRYRRNTQNGTGGSWEAARVLSTSATRGKGPDIAIGNTGMTPPSYDQVSVVWIGTLGLDTVYAARSTDLGATWDAPTVGASVTSGFIEAARVAVCWAGGGVLAWRHETATASTVYCKSMGPFVPAVVWTGPQGAFGDISMAYDSGRVYVTREDPGGPVQRVGTCAWPHPDFGPDVDLGNGGYRPQSDASSGYADHGCTAYTREQGPLFWEIDVSTGPGTETQVGPMCPVEPEPDIAADGCGNMHLVARTGLGTDDIWYFRYIRPVDYEVAAELDGVNKSDAAWGDFDGDGDLDVIICGETASNGLYYCLRLGTSPGAGDVVSGTYGTPLMGNVGQATSLHLNLPPATYYWSVRTIDPGFMRSAWSPEQVCAPHDIDLADNDVGNCVLTVTDQGILGFMSSAQSEGSGFIFPAGGDNLLYVGGLWVGESPAYVANRDYDADPAREWQVATAPDGRGWVDLNGRSDQDIHVGYTDGGAAVPRDLYVEQVSEAYSSAPDDDFIIIRYAIENRGSTSLSDLYVGQFLDMDIETFTENEGGTDTFRRMAYITGGPDDLYVATRLLNAPSGPEPLGNVTLIYNPTYVHPLGYITDPDKHGFLSASDPQYVLESSAVPEDDSALVAAGPVTIAPGEAHENAFAVVGGVGLSDLRENSDRAQVLYGPTVGLSDPLELPLGATRLLPNVPNPFNPRTTIRFELGRAGRARLAIYDVNGRLVRDLADRYWVAGQHAVTWDGRVEAGGVASSGVYFLLLEGDAGVSSRRVVLMK